MKKILIVLLLAVPVLAQDIPQPRPYGVPDLVSEIGQLHIQVKQLNEYVQTLQATVKALQDENAKLKAAK